VDHSLPFDFRFVEIDEQTQGQTGGLQIIDTLRGVFIGQAFRAFQLNDQLLFHHDISKVLTDAMEFRRES
jgi:hypothetical protein